MKFEKLPSKSVFFASYFTHWTRTPTQKLLESLLPLGIPTYLDEYIGADDKSLTDSLIGPVDKIDPAVRKKERNETIRNRVGGGHSHLSHAPVNRSPYFFYISLSPNAPIFQNFASNGPLFWLIRSKFSSQII